MEEQNGRTKEKKKKKSTQHHSPERPDIKWVLTVRGKKKEEKQIHNNLSSQYFSGLRALVPEEITLHFKWTCVINSGEIFEYLSELTCQ